MAKGNFSAAACIKEHLEVTYKRHKEETVRKYEGVLYNINSILRENGFDTNPHNIDEDTIEFILEVWSDYAISTKKWYLHIFNRYLKYFKNDVIERMQIIVGYDERPNVDWLLDEEYETLLNARLSPLEDIVIHLELCLGLRVSEVTKLMIRDVHFNNDFKKSYISVLGKGKGEGKWRTIPFHPMSKEIFEARLEYRAGLVQKIRAYNPFWRDPGNLLIWCHYENKPTGGAYTERGHSIDRGVINNVRDRLGMNFKNHTLRRTFGRKLYHAGIPIETISALYGHENIKTTLDYLGINLDDMSDALAKLYKHQLAIIKSKKGGE